MELPFEYGEIVSKNQFVNRTEERKRLATNLKGGLNTILISSRRLGKSSLVKQVELDIKDKSVVFCYLDLFRIKDESEFYEQLAAEVIKNTSNKVEDAIQKIKSYISRLTPKISFGHDLTQEYELAFDLKEVENNYQEILELPEKIATQKNIQLVICIDEFQNLSRFENPLLFQQRLRSIWQHHKNVSYCLYGSKKHMMVELFESKNMPFYKFGDLVFLSKISTDHWIEFIKKQFIKTGKKINTAIAKKISETVQQHSYYVQQLAHLVWVRTEFEVNEEIFKEAVSDLLKQNAIYFSREVEHLSNTQINYLIALSNKETNLHSTAVVTKYKLGSSSNVSRIKEALVKKDLIDTLLPSIAFNDPVFELWFRKTMV